MKSFTAFKTLKTYLLILLAIYLVIMISNIIIMKKDFKLVSTVFAVLAIISALYLVSTYKITIDRDAIVFYRIFGNDKRISYKYVDTISFVSPKNNHEKVVVITIDNDRIVYRIAVFDYDAIYSELRKICADNNIKVQEDKMSPAGNKIN